MAVGSFEIYTDNTGEFRFRFTANNGNIIFVSSEGYTNQADVERAVEIARTCTDAPLTVTV